MSLNEKINQDFLVAYKAKATVEVSVLRMLKSALSNQEIAKKLPKGEALPDDEVMAIIKSEIKKRKDSIEAYSSANRQDLVDQEEQEKIILEKYLPEQMSEDQIRVIITKVIAELGASGPADFGKVMGQAVAQTKNQADGQLIAKIVKEELGK